MTREEDRKIERRIASQEYLLFGKERADYLKQTDPVRYTMMKQDGTIFTHLTQVQEQAKELQMRIINEEMNTPVMLTLQVEDPIRYMRLNQNAYLSARRQALEQIVYI